MKALAILLCLTISFQLFSQTIIGNKFTDKSIGVSFATDSNWELDTSGSPLVTAKHKTKGELITFHAVKSKNNLTDYLKNIPDNEIEIFKSGLIKKYQSEGHTVSSVEMKKSTFLGYHCLISIAHLKGQPYLNGVPIYKKQIFFVTKTNYQTSFIYYLPEIVASPQEIASIEKQIKSFKEL